MTVRTILVCEAQVPFVHGGAEVHVRATRAASCARAATRPSSCQRAVQVVSEGGDPAARGRVAAARPQREQRHGRSTSSSRTKFPSYFVRHPNKVAWLIHQYRAAYELCGTDYSDFAHAELDVGLRDTLMRARHRDARRVPAVFANARNTAIAACEKFNGLAAEPLYHPPQLAAGSWPGPYGDYVLSVGPPRDGQARRPASSAPWRTSTAPVRLVVAGDGTQRANARARSPRSAASPIASRSWAASTTTIWSSCTRARSPSSYPPFDEDFGYVTLEAFLARKPVVTCTRLGRPDRVRARTASTGSSARRTRRTSRRPIDRLAADRRRARGAGRRRAHDVAAAITWDGVIERLIACHNCGDSRQRSRDETHHPDPVPERGRRRCRRRCADLPRADRRASTSSRCLVIDDGSRDGTSEVARAHGVRSRRPASAGTRGSRRRSWRASTPSLKAGRRLSSSTPTPTTSTPARDIPTLLAPLLRGEADIVIGDRNIAELEHMSLAQEAAAAARQLGGAAGLEHEGARHDERLPRLHARGRAAHDDRLGVLLHARVDHPGGQEAHGDRARADRDQPAHARRRGSSTASSATSSARRRPSSASTRCTSR